MSKLSSALLFSLFICLTSLAKNFEVHKFKKIQLTENFWAEGATFGDFNRDGENDIVCGPFWYEGPDFKTRHEYSPATQSFKRKKPDGSEESVPGFEGALGVNNTYSKNFFVYACDFNRDRWPDILILGFPGEDTSWFENPRNKAGHWTRHEVFTPTDNESPTFEDIVGDEKPELVCNSNGYFGYAVPDWSAPEKPWKFHAISSKGKWQRFTHGLGIGDINGDGLKDLIEKEGWWEQPKSLRGEPVWRFHSFAFAPGVGSAQMFAYDVNGDKRADVITSFNAHGFGLLWYEQLSPSESGEINFKQHVILNTNGKTNEFGVAFSQLHAVALADMNRDGLLDIVTGKRFWAHGAHGDADPNFPAVLYWFELSRGKSKTAEFIPHLIDDNSGVGTQVVVGNVNKDNLPDIVVGNKKGAFVLLHETKKVSREEWERAQPKTTRVVR
jgi:hypothetical protein